MKSIKIHKNLIFIVIIALFACAIAVGAFVMYRRQPSKGIQIFPKAEWECAEPVFYRQNDDVWKRDKMGTAADTMGGSGCLVTCLAASMEMQMKTVAAHPERPEAGGMTPGELNKELTEHQVYDERANVLWNPLREYLKGWSVETPSRPDGDEIEKMLREGHFPIVRVRMPRSGASHWVMLMEAKDGEYYCMDPLHGENEMIPLSEFGSTVYAVRCIAYGD